MQRRRRNRGDPRVVSFFDDPSCGWDLPDRGPEPTGPSAWSPLGDFTWNGSKFPGGLPLPADYFEDKPTLRKHSAEFFRKNLYFRGVIRRLLTNEINQGLTPDVNPDEDVLGVPEGSLEGWVELTEARFNLWAGSADLCDLNREKAFGEIQESARLEAIIDGDVLVRLHTDPLTNLPRVELIPGSRVVSPISYRVPAGLTLVDGVELDANGVHIAYHVATAGKTERILAKGEKTGRRMAWLLYSTERRISDVRGECLLGLVLQSLKEVDRYRDAVQRKAAINALVAMVVQKTQALPSSLPFQGGAVARGTVQTSTPEGNRSFKTAGLLPGMIIEEMQAGEELKMIGGEGTDVNLGPFEAVIISAISWALEIPPEILTLSFEKNYSASQAAINEFKNYIRKRWKRSGDTFCTRVYIDWLVSEALTGKHDTPGLIDAMLDPLQYDRFAALTSVEWYGSVKPATDFLKACRGSQVAVSEGWSTNAIEARALTGTSFRLNAKQLARENKLKIKAWLPLAEFLREYPNMPQIQAMLDTQGGPNDILGDSGE